MSIATEITRLQGAKADLKTAIEAKGVTVPSSAKIDEYDTYVSQIPSGGGDSELVVTLSGSNIDRNLLKSPIPSVSTMSKVVIGKKIYMFGYLDTNNQNVVCKYDYETNQFTTLSATFEDNYYLGGHTIGTIVNNTDIYLVGGLLSGGNAASNKIYKFDTTNDTLTRIGLIDANTANPNLVIYNGYLYIIGGRTTTSSIQTSLYKYNLSDNTSSRIMGYSLNSFYSRAQYVVGSVVYLFGGRIGTGTSTSSVTNTAYKLDMSTDVLSTLANMPDYRAGSDSVVELYNNELYIFGGKNRNSGSDPYAALTIFKYNIANDSYSTLTPQTLVHINPAHLTIGTKLYLVGGASASNYPNNNISIFDFANQSSIITHQSDLIKLGSLTAIYESNAIILLSNLATSTPYDLIQRVEIE